MPKGSGGDSSHDSERLLQLLGRMRTALQLGKRPSSRKGGELRWANTDAQVQGQAVRAIAAFVAAIPSRPAPIGHLQGDIQEAVVALEYLLVVEQEAIYRQAAQTSAALVKATRLQYMVRLLGPLACLLAPSKTSEAAVFAATALQILLVNLRFQVSSEDDPTWKVLQESEALKHVLWRLENSHRAPVAPDFAEVLAAILERWPRARYQVGKLDPVRTCLLQHCTSSNSPVVEASLRACQALALCAGVAGLFLRDGSLLWETLASCLQESKPLRVKREALRLLSLLGRLSLFAASFRGPHMRAILEGCLRNINEGNKSRLTVPEQQVVVEAAHTTSVILRWAGEHHNVVLELGIFKFTFLQLTLGEKKSATNLKIWEGLENVEWKSRGAGKVTSSLRCLLWEIVGCLAAHFSSSTTMEDITGRPATGPGLGGLTVFACAALLRALHRSGHVEDHTQVPAFGSGQEQNISSQELLQICKTMFFLLSSRSLDVALPTKACMETAMKFHDQTWLPRLVESLALGHTGSSPVKPESVNTSTYLFALACFSYFPECRELLDLKRTLDVLEAILKLYGETALATKSSCVAAKESVAHQRAGVAAKTCCEEIANDWEGSDTVLLASLCAFTRLGPSLSCTGEEELKSMLWRLAECTTVAAGVRCWAASGLACFNIYGFPSSLGRHMRRLLEESLFSDIVFLLKDGCRLLAHGVVLAVQCPSVLPERLGEVQLSKLISSRSFKALLEYAYSGVVHLDAGDVEEMKILSKRCGLDSLSNLLHNRVPVFGLPPASCNLAPALTSGRYSDIILRGKHQGDERSQGGTLVHAHRAVLSSRCEYYRALFCSGMRESTAEVIEVDISEQSLQTLVMFWYSGRLVRLTEETGWCAWNNLETEEQVLYLQSLIELAQFSGQLLMTDLQQECDELVLQHIDGNNVHLGPSVVNHAAKCAHWDLVNLCAFSLAPAFAHLRDTGALESLDESLRDLLRVARVQFLSHLESAG